MTNSRWSEWSGSSPKFLIEIAYLYFMLLVHKISHPLSLVKRLAMAYTEHNNLGPHCEALSLSLTPHLFSLSLQIWSANTPRVTTRPVFGGIVLEFNSLSRIPGKGCLDSLSSGLKLTLNFNRTSVWSLFSCYIDFKNILLSKFQIYVSYYVGICFHVRY